MRRLSIEEVRERLLRLGIELVSKEYTGINDLIDCRCLRCDHLWPTRLRHINHGHGCPRCGIKLIAESKCKPMEQIVSFLKPLGITVLAVYHEKPRTRVRFFCEVCSLEDTISWNDLRRRGCPKCGRKRGADARRHRYNYVQQYLANLGVELLSKQYKDSKTKLSVRFPCGCKGRADFNSLQSGRLCRDCAPNARVNMEDYRELAQLHGGKILTMARTTTQPSQWKCAKKSHPSFWRAYNVIKKSAFCPECSEGFSERACRTAAVQLFGGPFEKLPLKGAYGVGGGNLRFDAYSEPLKLAVEHNGPQHYQPIRFGNQTEIEALNSFRKQQVHDRRRREFCRAKGITLIEVPELGRRIKVEDLKEFIRSECLKAGFSLPKDFDRVQLKLEAHNLTTTVEEMWERVLKRVWEVGYILKTKNYPGANGWLSLLCRNNHTYKPRVASFLKGHTCRRCFIQKLSIPVVALPLGTMNRNGDYQSARVFNSIEDCAKALDASSTSVRIVVKGRGNSSMGFGIAQITLEQANRFRENKKEFEKFCRAKWPSPKTYDRQDGSRKYLSKPVRFSDGREFPSKVAAAKVLGVSKAAIYYAVRTGSPCKGQVIQTLADFDSQG